MFRRGVLEMAGRDTLFAGIALLCRAQAIHEGHHRQAMNSTDQALITRNKPTARWNGLLRQP